MILNKEKIKNFIKIIDKKTMFISAITTLMIIYFIDPLINVELTDWNRTFCTAILSGISINKRINNLYLLYFLEIPGTFSILTFLYGILFEYREKYKSIFFNLCAILIFPVVFLFITRYKTMDSGIDTNILIQTILSFFCILLITAILDKNSKLSKKYIFMFCGAYLVGIVTLNLLLRLQNDLQSIIIMSTIFLIYIAFILKTNIGKKIFHLSYNLICFVVWVPTYVCVIREIFFTLNEKGITIMKYYTNICEIVFLYLIASLIIVILFRKKKISFTTFGCIGIIVSLAMTKYSLNYYQYVFNYKNYNYLYELSNISGAFDILLYKKLPIIDAFSAHALFDICTRILYGFIHSDVKGIIVNPYAGLVYLFGIIILFFILKNFFEKDTAVLMVCLFPFGITSIKAITICFLVVVALLHTVKRKTIKSYLIFWISALVCAFYRYDEGISLGIACILAFLIMLFINKDWKNIKKFIIVGTSIGIIILSFYFIYCYYTNISAVSRLREWMSLSLGSSTSWATEYFGDPTQIVFLLSYYVVPILVISILIIAIIKYCLRKDNTKIAILTIMFCIAQLLYIARTVIFHNLYICSGLTGVLLNFIHWTVSFFVLYEMTIKNASKEKKLLVWNLTFGLIVIIESFVIVNNYEHNTTLYEGANLLSKKSKLSNDMTSIWGEERIVYNDETVEFINQFRQVFDTLLTDDQTFLDFANITSLYFLTERQRPCYVTQMPSLLTDLYSQECFLNEISEYDIPLAIIGASDDEFIQSMMGVSHNVRYYKIAEHIYKNYRPLVLTGDFTIWCKKDYYDEFKSILTENVFFENGYTLIDYGYDLTNQKTNKKGNIEYIYWPYHQFQIDMIPYIWANFDEYEAIKNSELVKLHSNVMNLYEFEGSKTLEKNNGNYLYFECTNPYETKKNINVIFYDKETQGARFEYDIKIVPGTNKYLIRASQDYFWYAFNIDNIYFESQNDESFNITNVRILEGD